MWIGSFSVAAVLLAVGAGVAVGAPSTGSLAGPACVPFQVDKEVAVSASSAESTPQEGDGKGRRVYLTSPFNGMSTTQTVPPAGWTPAGKSDEERSAYGFPEDAAVLGVTVPATGYCQFDPKDIRPPHSGLVQIPKPDPAVGK
jgi:hypothetical protein